MCTFSKVPDSYTNTRLVFCTSDDGHCRWPAAAVGTDVPVHEHDGAEGNRFGICPHTCRKNGRFIADGKRRAEGSARMRSVRVCCIIVMYSFLFIASLSCIHTCLSHRCHAFMLVCCIVPMHSCLSVAFCNAVDTFMLVCWIVAMHSHLVPTVTSWVFIDLDVVAVATDNQLQSWYGGASHVGWRKKT